MAVSFQGDEKRDNVLDLLCIQHRAALPGRAHAGKAFGAVVRGHDALGIELATVNDAQPELCRAPAAARTGNGRRDIALKRNRNPQCIRKLVAQHAKSHLAVGNDGLAPSGISCQVFQRRSDTVLRNKRDRAFSNGQAANKEASGEEAQP